MTAQVTTRYNDETQSFASYINNKNKQNGNEAINNNNFFSCYFDGELESIMGYDIVVHVGGEMPIINNGDIIPVDVVACNRNESINAVMLVGVYKYTEEFDHRFYALVMTIDDAEMFLSQGKLTAEVGGVNFNKLIKE